MNPEYEQAVLLFENMLDAIPNVKELKYWSKAAHEYCKAYGLNYMEPYGEACVRLDRFQ